MSELKIEQIDTFLKSMHLEDEDIAKIKTEEVTDFEPYVSKVKAGIKENLLADTTFIDTITEPFKSAPIGKENQLKKEARKFYGLTMTEDELKKTPFNDILKKGDELRKNTVIADVDNYKNTATEWMEKFENLQTQYNEVETKAEQKWAEKIKDGETRQELVEFAAKEIAGIAKENLPFFTKTYIATKAHEGIKVTIDERKQLRLLDKDGLPAKDQAGNILKIKEDLKEYSAKVSGNIAPKGTATITGNATTNKNSDLVNLIGKGFQ